MRTGVVRTTLQRQLPHLTKEFEMEVRSALLPGLAGDQKAAFSRVRRLGNDPGRQLENANVLVRMAAQSEDADMELLTDIDTRRRRLVRLVRLADAGHLIWQ